MKDLNFSGFAVGLCLLGALNGCEPPAPGPQGDSHTNWLRTCESDSECGTGLSCVCGVCTARCSNDEACSSAPGASCVLAESPGAVAVCGGEAPPALGMCLPTCAVPSDCANGQE